MWITERRVKREKIKGQSENGGRVTVDRKYSRFRPLVHFVHVNRIGRLRDGVHGVPEVLRKVSGEVLDPARERECAWTDRHQNRGGGLDSVVETGRNKVSDVDTKARLGAERCALRRARLELVARSRTHGEAQGSEPRKLGEEVERVRTGPAILAMSPI